MVSARTKARIFASLLQWGIDRFAQANAVGVAETGAEGVSHRLTDEVLSLIIKKLFSIVLLREHDGADGIFLFCFAFLCKYCRKKYINIAKSLEILSVLYYHIT